MYSATYTPPAALITAMSADKQLMDEVHENADFVIKQQIEKAKNGVSSKIAWKKKRLIEISERCRGYRAKKSPGAAPRSRTT